MTDSIEFHLVIEGNDPKASPVDLLTQHSGLSRSTIKQAMSKGAVWRQKGKKVTPLRRNPTNCQDIEQLHFYYQPRILNEKPLEAHMLCDKESYSVWVKPRGMRSQGSRFADHCALVRVAEQSIGRPCRIVHRLDQGACGLILLAHNKKAARHLSELFAQHAIDKRYHIIVAGQFPSTPQVCQQLLDEKSAYSEFKILESLNNGASLVQAKIKTGRKHQVRRHAASLGFPIVGDERYNEFYIKKVIESDTKNNQNADSENTALQLCAQSLQFVDHLGEMQHFEIDSRQWLLKPA